jgi:outer membrane protein assembly factor BamE (lipoprotein component of BamABCDE complex)
VKILVTLLLILFSSACMVIPTPEHRLGGRVPCDDEKTAFIVKEKTSKEEVLLKLGEPDLVLSKERVFVYRWEMVAAYFIVGGYGAGAMGPIQRPHFLIIEFNDKNIISRHEVNASVFSSATPSVETFKAPQPDRDATTREIPKSVQTPLPQ